MGGKVLLLGRLAFSFFFLYAGFNHLTKLSAYSQYAGASGVPAPTLLTAISGLMLLAGGLSVLLGVQVRWGALRVRVRIRIGSRIGVHFVQRDGAVDGDELQRRATGADGAAQMPRGDLADDLHREIGLNTAVHRFGIDLGVELQR